MGIETLRTSTENNGIRRFEEPQWGLKPLFCGIIANSDIAYVA